MKFTQLALTLLLVAGGIFVYDALVARAPEEAATEEIRSTEPPPPHVEEELPSFAVLEGRGDDIWRSDMERRIEQMEQTFLTAARTQAVDGGAIPGLPGAAGAEGEDAGSGVEGDENGTAGRRRITPKVVEDFRALLEIVERQRRDEQTRRKMREGLQKIGVELNDAQTGAVVDLTLKFYRGVQSALKKMPRGEENGDQRVAVYQQMQETYADELYGIVPRTEADLIMDAINRQANRLRKDSK